MPRRTEDEGQDAWSTFNVVQENLLRGGLRYVTEQGRNRSVRGISSIRTCLSSASVRSTATSSIGSILPRSTQCGLMLRVLILRGSILYRSILRRSMLRPMKPAGMATPAVPVNGRKLESPEATTLK